MTTKTLSNIVFSIGLMQMITLGIMLTHFAIWVFGIGDADLNYVYVSASLIAAMTLRAVERALLSTYRRRWLEFGVTDEYLNQRATAHKIA